MRAANSYPQPWADLAARLRTQNKLEFVRYRDAFYNFAMLAGLSAEWAIAAFNGPGASEASRTFFEANTDMVSFLDYLRKFGAGETGLSGALEDNLAEPSFDNWMEFQRRQ
jgi:hypothetical protein